MSEFKKKMFLKYKTAEFKMNVGTPPKGRTERNYFKLKGKFDRVLNKMGDPYESIFRNTYLKDGNKYWWATIYSSSSYYRYLKVAREAFFKLYYRGRV